MSKSVINSSQNAPFYTNFFKIFRGSMPPDPTSLSSRPGARKHGLAVLSPSFYISKLNMSADDTCTFLISTPTPTPLRLPTPSKIGYDISCKLSKRQFESAPFSGENKITISNCHQLKLLPSMLSVNRYHSMR